MLIHPFPNMSEPQKATCYLTDYKDYDEDHLARLYLKASLHAIDSFFMQVRRRLSEEAANELLGLARLGARRRLH